MMTKAIVSMALIILAFGAGPAHARGSVPIVNLEGNAIVTPDGREFTLEEVARRIRDAAAAQQYSWAVTSSEPGKLQLSTLVRGKHTVVVDVTFDATTYSIKYSSSINMNYESKKGRELIHPFYNKWVQQLKQGIDMQMRKP